MKYIHEVRDPIHVFIRIDDEERKLIDSLPFQRLRHIHQLAMTFLVYPGATHRRFEHSLGVMELASRVYDVVTRRENIVERIENDLREIAREESRNYWRKVLRVAALCHDLGHLPFSHAAEKELLPEGWNHERLTREIILNEDISTILSSMTPPLNIDHVIKLAVGPKVANDLSFTPWEALLSEIITGDSFGVDRIDYLLRDSYHTGVGYGRFDHYRLIDTLRILPPAPSCGEEEESNEPSLGVEEGGIHSAEALLLARYFIFIQVYLHPIRRIYDIHLRDFLKEWLKNGVFSTGVPALLSVTDNEVSSAIIKSAMKEGKIGHSHARRITFRKHFKLLYVIMREDKDITPNAGPKICDALEKEFGVGTVKYDRKLDREQKTDFPVECKQGHIASSFSISDVLKNIPSIAVEYVFVDPDFEKITAKWLKEKKQAILTN